MRMQKRMWQFGVLAALVISANRAEPQIPAGARVAARVNGEEISLAELQAVLDLRPSPVPLSKDLHKEMRKAALDMLIDDLLMRQFLRKAAQPVNPADVQKEYDKLHEALKAQKKTFEQFLQEGKMTAEQLRADIVARLQWRAYLESSYPEAEIKSYYDANKLFFDNVLVHASHILVKVNASAGALERQQARTKLDVIRQEIVAGKITFDAAARKYSDCPTKEKGGDLGQFPYKFRVVEPLARAAFSTKKGEVTDVVASEFGFHILKVIDRTAGEPSRFEEIRDIVRDVIAQEADLYQRILAEQKKTAKIELTVQ
jgi:parvulin-like peptidyl-prolyl isomerase